MKRDNKKEVMNALIMVFQFGINMIVPIFLCKMCIRDRSYMSKVATETN